MKKLFSFLALFAVVAVAQVPAHAEDLGCTVTYYPDGTATVVCSSITYDE